ncbi:hypothetical protein A3Q56_04925 [Intoshia linei]|uniref:Retropepsins domain-containing protein n=1 Tax=Intoshia linei TaxID=1819745 RepID=A0A177B128_9BILA|nr:hypothetical protein A3Q56_04925 [Intoshia linei]
MLLDNDLPKDVPELILKIKQMEGLKSESRCNAMEKIVNLKIEFPIRKFVIKINRLVKLAHRNDDKNVICQEIILNCLNKFNWTSYTSIINITTNLETRIELLEMNPPKPMSLRPLQNQFQHQNYSTKYSNVNKFCQKSINCNYLTPLFYINCTINNISINCLIDTGAVSSYLPDTFKANRPSSKRYTDVKGNSILNKGTLQIVIFIKSLNCLFTHNFVISNVQKPILGFNFFLNHNIDILQNLMRLNIPHSKSQISFIKNKISIGIDPCDPNINGKIDTNMVFLNKSFEMHY